jgi:hypothetical protein
MEDEDSFLYGGGQPTAQGQPQTQPQPAAMNAAQNAQAQAAAQRNYDPSEMFDPDAPITPQEMAGVKLEQMSSQQPQAQGIGGANDEDEVGDMATRTRYDNHHHQSTKAYIAI